MSLSPAAPPSDHKPPSTPRPVRPGGRPGGRSGSRNGTPPKGTDAPASTGCESPGFAETGSAVKAPPPERPYPGEGTARAKRRSKERARSLERCAADLELKRTRSFERERAVAKKATLAELNRGVPVLSAIAPEVAAAVETPAGVAEGAPSAATATACAAIQDAVPIAPYDGEAEARAAESEDARLRARSLETQLARALGQAAAIVEWSDAKDAYTRRERRAAEHENAELRARLEAYEAGGAASLPTAPASDGRNSPDHDDDDDDDDDFGWVPPSAHTKTTAWSVIGDRGLRSPDSGRSQNAEIRRLERKIADDRAAHKNEVRSLEMQLQRMRSQLSKMQTWADDKFEHIQAGRKAAEELIVEADPLEDC